MRKSIVTKRITCIIIALTLILGMSITTAARAEAATRKTDVTKPAAGNTFIYFKGTFYTDEVKKALKRINEIRKEACEEGVINPATGKKLKASDYKAINWSSDLEWIAQTRAAEASIRQGHTRTNGTSCFTINYNGTQSWGEVLAWNYDGMVEGVNQWYGEKADWVNQNENAVTGHYTQMIDPTNTYVGLGTFGLPDGSWICTAGEFSSASEMESRQVGVSGKYNQVIEAPKSNVKAYLKNATVSKGKTKKLVLKMKFTTESAYGTERVVVGNAYGKTKWSTSNKSVVSISSKGVVKGKKKGTAKVTAVAANGKKDSCTVTVK